MARLTLAEAAVLLRPAWVLEVDPTFWDLTPTQKGMGLDAQVKRTLAAAGSPFEVPEDPAAPFDLSLAAGQLTLDMKLTSRDHAYLSHNELLFGNAQTAAGRTHGYALYRRRDPTHVELELLVEHGRLLALPEGSPLHRGGFWRMTDGNAVHCAATGRVEHGWSFARRDAAVVSDLVAGTLVAHG